MNRKKRVVITGCSRGLGRAMVESFLQRGHEVFGCSSHPGAIAAMGDGDHFFTCDTADDDAVRDFAKNVLSRGGPPDVLINNAAVMNQNAPLWEISPGDFDRVMAVNISGPANLIRHFVPAMIEVGSGVIVNFSSYWGRSTANEVAPYCASKWAIEGLTSALAQELPQGLAAVALNPGIIDTDMLRLCLGPGAASYLSPREWAAAAVPFIEGFSFRENGQSLTVPGQ